jgi:DnaJ-class molecular chaperone
MRDRRKSELRELEGLVKKLEKENRLLQREVARLTKEIAKMRGMVYNEPDDKVVEKKEEKKSCKKCKGTSTKVIDLKRADGKINNYILCSQCGHRELMKK